MAAEPLRTPPGDEGPEVDIETIRGKGLTVTPARYHGRRYAVLSEWYEFRPGDPDTRQRTGRYVLVLLSKAPELRRALEELEDR